MPPPPPERRARCRSPAPACRDRRWRNNPAAQPASSAITLLPSCDQLRRIALARVGRMLHRASASDSEPAPAFSLLGLEIRIARTHRQSIRLAHDRADDQLHIHIQVAHHPPQHCNLRGVFLPEEGAIGPHNLEQLGNDSCHSAKVSGPRSAVELVAQSAHLHMCRRARRDTSRSTVGANSTSTPRVPPAACCRAPACADICPDLPSAQIAAD